MPLFFKCSSCGSLLATVTYVKHEGFLVRVRRWGRPKEAWRIDLESAVHFIRSYFNDTCPFCGKKLYEEPRLVFPQPPRVKVRELCQVRA